MYPKTVVSWFSNGSMITASPVPIKKTAQNMVRNVRSILHKYGQTVVECGSYMKHWWVHLLAKEELSVGECGVPDLVDVRYDLKKASYAGLVVQVKAVETE